MSGTAGGTGAGERRRSKAIPGATLAFIGGSGTLGLPFPESAGMDGVVVEASGLVWDTPFGESPPFKLIRFEGLAPAVLSCRMHGRRRGVDRGEASRQVFWVLREAGVKRIISEGGVGSANPLLDPGDLLLPTDYIDFSLRRAVHLAEDHLCIMRESICPEIHSILLRACEEEVRSNRGRSGSREGEGVPPLGRVFSRGVYVVTDGRHFESPAETAAFRQWGGDVVGMSLCPQVYLAREIGACYAHLCLIVNYGEGVVKPWEHRVLAGLFQEAAPAMARIVIRSLRELAAGEQDEGKPAPEEPAKGIKRDDGADVWEQTGEPKGEPAVETEEAVEAVAAGAAVQRRCACAGLRRETLLRDELADL